MEVHVLTQYAAATNEGDVKKFETLTDIERSIAIQTVSESILSKAVELKELLLGKNIDLDFIVNIVASYLLTLEDSNINAENVIPPHEIFLASLLPQLNGEVTIEAEVLDETGSD